jgi:DNA-binding transcriptional ArsR family regulator
MFFGANMTKKRQEQQEQRLIAGQKVKLVDPVSGAETFAVYGGKKKFSLSEEWTTSTKIGRSKMSNLKTDKSYLFNPTARVALWCEAHLTYGNFLDVTWKDAVEELGLTQPQVSKAVKQLQEAGYLISDKNRRWRIHPEYAYFGSQRSLKKEREKATVIYGDFSKKKRIDKAIHDAVLRYEKFGDIDLVLAYVNADDIDVYDAVENALLKIAHESNDVTQ